MIEFTITYNKFKVKVYNYVLRMLPDKMNAEDIVQNVFLNYYRNMEAVKNKESTIYYLLRSARNEVYGILRSKNSRVDQYNVDDASEVIVEGGISPENEYETMEMKEMVGALLDSINPVMKEIYVLREYGGCNYREISDILGIPEKLVKSRLFKVRQLLIEYVSKKIEE